MAGKMRDMGRMMRRRAEFNAAAAQREAAEQSQFTETILTPVPAMAVSDNVPLGLRVTAAWAWRLAIIAVCLFAVGKVLAFFEVIVIPLLLALLVAAILMPFTNWLHRKGMRRGWAVLVTMLGAVAVFSVLIAAVADRFSAGLPELIRSTQAGLAQLQDWLRRDNSWLSSLQLSSGLEQARRYLTEHGGNLAAHAATATNTLGHFGAGFFLALFATAFFLLDGAKIWRWFLAGAPASFRGSLHTAFQNGWETLTKYVRATMIVAGTNGAAITIGASLLGVPLALPIGVVVFLGAFIPIIGTLVSGVVAVLVALVAKGVWVALIMLIVLVGVHEIEVHVLQPFLLGKAVQVHPLAVIVAIAAGVTLAGVAGGMFAVPIVAVANTVIQTMRGTRSTSPTRSAPDEVGAECPDPGGSADPIVDVNPETGTSASPRGE